MEKILILPVLIGFLVTLFFIPHWIRKAKKAGIKGEDVHKLSKENIAEAGGVPVLIGFLLGVLSYVAIKTFYFGSKDNLIEIFGLISVILIVSFIGLLDDILGWKIGLTPSMRIFLLIFASVPLIVINAGVSKMMGANLGLLYPLFFIPLGIVGATATFNLLAGYNGLESSQGILILTALSIITYINNSPWLSLICLIMVVCLIAFYIFNKYPARVFPGDILTYPGGALIAVIAILGNVEKIAVFFFIPYIIETILKVRGKLKKESFAKVNSEGNLEMPYEKFYGLEHIAIWILKRIKKDKKVREQELVYLINLFQILIIVVGFILFRGGLL